MSSSTPTLVTSDDSNVEGKVSGSVVPAIPIDPSAHKVPIAFRVSIIFANSCLVQEACYFGLRYGTTLKMTYILTIVGVVFGLPSFYSVFERLYRLTRREPTYRPLGCQHDRRALDFFMLNFILGIVYIAAVIAAGTSVGSVGILSMPLSLLMLHVCGEILLTPALRAMGFKTPFRVSSTPAGEPLPSAVAVVVEDILAVDAGGGLELRRAWVARCRESHVFRAMLHRLDLVWGATGVVVAAVVIAVIWAVPDRSIGFGLGMFAAAATTRARVNRISRDLSLTTV